MTACEIDVEFICNYISLFIFNFTVTVSIWNCNIYIYKWIILDIFLHSLGSVLDNLQFNIRSLIPIISWKTTFVIDFSIILYGPIHFFLKLSLNFRMDAGSYKTLSLT